MRRAVLYIRVSTTKQAEEGLSLKDQERKLRAYCDLSDLKPVAVLVESGVSGSIPIFERPEGAKAKACLESGEATELVATKLDRLFRSAADALNTAKWLTDDNEKPPCNLHLLDLKVDTSQPQGRFMLAIFSSIAELERDQARSRTADAVAGKRIRGEPMGRPPYGYSYSADRLRLEPVAEEESPLLAVGAMLRLGMGVRRVAREMGLWYPQSGGWSPSMIQRINKSIRADEGYLPKTEPPTPQEIAMLRGVSPVLSLQSAHEDLGLPVHRIALVLAVFREDGLLSQQGKRRSLSLDQYYIRSTP